MGSIPDAGQKAVATFGLMDREDSDGVPLGRKKGGQARQKCWRNVGELAPKQPKNTPKKASMRWLFPYNSTGYWWWDGTLRQTYVTQRLGTAANSCGKVRNPAPVTGNPTSSAQPRSSAKRITQDASSIPICGIEPASVNRYLGLRPARPISCRPRIASARPAVGECALPR